MLKQRIITGIILLIGMCTALFWATDDIWTILCGVLALLILWEYARLQKMSVNTIKIYLLLSSIIGLWLFLSKAQAPDFIHIFILFFWLLIVPLQLKWQWHIKQTLWQMALGWLMLIPFWQAMVWLRLGEQKHIWSFLALMALVWVADIGAYIFGRLWGKRKLAPSISPGKSWEGAVGGVLSVWIYLALVTHWGLFPAYSAIYWYIPIGLVLTAVSIEGDLLESLFKRHAQVKDSSRLLPGHGGVYDRTDSLIAVLSVVSSGLALGAPSL